MKIPSGKTKVEMRDYISSAVDTYYVDGYVQGADSVTYAVVVNLSDRKFRIASLDEILAIVPERIKTKRSSNLNPAKVIELWNKFANENKLPQKRAATDGLKKSINSITEQQKWTINNWDIFFYALSISDFLMGKVDDFKLSLDWLVKPANFSEVNAGNYHELFSSKKHTESKKRG